MSRLSQGDHFQNVIIYNLNLSHVFSSCIYWRQRKIHSILSRCEKCVLALYLDVIKWPGLGRNISGSQPLEAWLIKKWIDSPFQSENWKRTHKEFEYHVFILIFYFLDNLLFLNYIDILLFDDPYTVVTRPFALQIYFLIHFHLKFKGTQLSVFKRQSSFFCHGGIRNNQIQIGNR